MYLLGNYKILLLKKSHLKPIVVKEGYNYYLSSLLHSNGLLDRGISYAIDKFYENLAIVDIHASGFEHFPYLSNTAIISPFKSLKDYQSFKANIKGIDFDSFITPSKVKEIIPPKLVKWLIENKPVNVQSRTEEDVYEGYKGLIIELLENLS
jgi:hypothetical protein